MTGLTQRPLLIFYWIWLVNNISNRILECSYSFSLMQTNFYLEWIHLVPPEIFLLRNASIDHQNQSIVEKVTFLMRNPLRIATKKKIEKKEGCRTKKKLLMRHSGKRKLWIWNATVAWQVSSCKIQFTAAYVV